ncbi:radical SAM protein [candidate division KSB1 bacterium]|nr:radical SAM protein [candidate division KSB1 bacterium]
MDTQKKLHKNPHISIIEKNNHFLLINHDQTSWLRTNESGKFIFDQCDGSMNFDEIVEHNAKIFEIDPSLIKESINDFVCQCLDKEILFASDNGAQQDSSVKAASAKEEEAIVDISLHLSNECNLVCWYCPNRKSAVSEVKEMSQVNFGKIVREISLINPTNIILTGGEPLLRDDIIDICRIAKESGHRVTIMTNLTRGDKSFFEDLLKYLDRLIISLDGPTADVNDAIRGAGSFDDVVSRIKMLKELGFETMGVCHTPDKSNVDSSPQMIDFIYKYKLKELIINRVFPLNQNIDQSKMLSDEEFAALYTKIGARFKQWITKQLDQSITRGVGLELVLLKATGIDATDVFFDGAKGKSCGLGVTKLSVDVDGNLYPCRFLHRSEFNLGNILEEGFQNVYKVSLEKYRPMRHETPEECADCYLEQLCDRGCRASSFYVKSDLSKKDTLCQTIYADIERVIWGSSLDE